LAEVSEVRLLPDAAKLLLGKVWTEYGLGVEGSYRRLYYNTKNEQIRNYMKGKINDDSTAIVRAGTDSAEHNQFD
jgi:hypothetical protein